MYQSEFMEIIIGYNGFCKTILGAKTDFDEIEYFWSKRPDLDQKTMLKKWRPEAFPKDQNGQIWSPKRPSGNPAMHLQLYFCSVIVTHIVVGN